MNIKFLATVAVIAPDPITSRDLYAGALGLPLQSEGDGYYHSEQIAGCKSFGIWPLAQAARACFGTEQWPADLPVPQVSIEFDVESADAVAPATQELEHDGYELLHAPRTESWCQTVARLQITRRRDHRRLLYACAARLTPVYRHPRRHRLPTQQWGELSRRLGSRGDPVSRHASSGSVTVGR